MQSTKHSKGGWGDGEWGSPQTPQVRLIQQTCSRRAHHTLGTGEHLGQHLPGQKEDSKTGKSGKDGLKAKESWGLISGVSMDQRQKTPRDPGEGRGQRAGRGGMCRGRPHVASRGLGGAPDPRGLGRHGRRAGRQQERQGSNGDSQLVPRAELCASHTVFHLPFPRTMRPCAHCT